MSTADVDAIEAKALATEQSIDSKLSNKAALEAAISSAELYMRALKLTKSPSEKTRLNGKLSELLQKAETLKGRQNAAHSTSDEVLSAIKYPKSTRTLSTREQIILLEGSKLNGAVFKPWKDSPEDAEFELKAGEDLYSEPPLSLSEDQLRSFAGWERGTQAITKIKMYKDGTLLPNDPIMSLPGKPDLVQDMASDCSVVASLCAGAARAEQGHPRILGSIVHPYELSDQSVKISPNGKYVLRLYFNGCWRRVDIDDFLPTSKTSRVLHVVDRSHPGLLWPALIEKAYLKVRGGYDFPGSNSGTDLAVFTSWIPHQVFLHDEDVDQEALWNELEQAFGKGNIMLTIGTGKLSRREQKQLGLAAEHDYAILDIKSRDGVKEMLIKNPWSDGEVWKGASRRKPNPSHELDDESVSNSTFQEITEMLPGTFWMDYNSIFHYFENLYINWNPALFSSRQDFHFSWQVTEGNTTSDVFIDNPQFSIETTASGPLWLLLNRHFRTGDHTHANSGKNGYISLYLYDNNGYRVLLTDSTKMQAPFVDSPNTLLRFETQAKTSYTIVAVVQDFPYGKHNFSLSAFAQSTIKLLESPSKYGDECRRTAAWTRHTSGGNTDSPNYLSNPQFTIPITNAKTSIALVLRLIPDPNQSVDQSDIHVKILLVYSPAQRELTSSDTQIHRIEKLRNHDTVASSGDYRRGCAVIETTLDKGMYTVLCSTFTEGQNAKFTLDLYTSAPQKSLLLPVPSQGSGRLSIVSGPAGFGSGVVRVAASVITPRISKATFIARAKLIPGARMASSSSLYKVGLYQGQGSYTTLIASSSNEEESFSSIYSGLRIQNVDLNPNMHAANSGGLWLVLERPSQSAAENSSGSFYIEVEILSEERIQLGDWQSIQL